MCFDFLYKFCLKYASLQEEFSQLKKKSKLIPLQARCGPEGG